MAILKSDLFRAGLILIVSLAGARAVVGMASASPVSPAALPSDPLIYGLVNITDDMSARSACPLDMAAARSRIEASHDLVLEFSPLADGPDVLMHEFSVALETASPAPVCRWSVAARYQGQTTRWFVDAPSQPALSSLETIARDTRPLVATGAR